MRYSPSPPPSYIYVSTVVGVFVVLIVVATIASALIERAFLALTIYIVLIVLAAAILAIPLILSNLRMAQQHQAERWEESTRRQEKSQQAQNELALLQTYATVTAALAQLQATNTEASPADPAAIEKLQRIVDQLSARVDLATQEPPQPKQVRPFESLHRQATAALEFAFQQIETFAPEALRTSAAARQKLQQACRKIAARFERLAASPTWDDPLKAQFHFEQLEELIAQFHHFAEYPEIESKIFLDPQTGQFKQEPSSEIEDYLTALEATVEELTEWQECVLGLEGMD